MSDLDNIADEIGFGSNKLFLAYPNTIWRPTYYMVQSRIVMEESLDEILSHNPTLFLSKSALAFRPRIAGVSYFNVDYKFDYSNPRFQEKPLGHLYGGYTVLYSCLQLAYYMGIREIYLTGVDFDYAMPEQKIGNFGIFDKFEIKDEKNYFSSEYKKPGQVLLSPHLDRQEFFYRKAKQIFESAGGSIYNATRGGKLEVFERVDWDALFPSKIQ